MSCNWAHIPHERGGAPWRVVLYGYGRGWGGGSEVDGEGMREERTKISHDGIDVISKL